MKTSLPLSLLLLAPGLALAGPGTAAKLAQGEQTPAEAVKAWKQEGVTSSEALRQITQVRTKQTLAAGNHTLKISDAHQRETNLLVHVPAQTRKNGRYGLLVVLHGYGGNAKQLFQFGQNIAPQGTVIAAISAKKIPEKLRSIDIPKEFAFAAKQFSRHWWSYRYDGFAMLTIRRLLRELPIDTNRVELAGYSMGGFGTWNIGLRHHQHFAGLAPMAGGLSRSEYIMRRDPRSRVLLNNVKMQPAFFIHGDADRVVPHRFSKSIAAELTALGAPHTYISVPEGSHVLRPFLRGNEQTKVLKAFLAKSVRDPNPRVVTHAAVSPDSGRAYWTKIDGLKGATATLRAEVKRGNRIEVTSENVTKLTVYLDPDLVDVNRPVTIVLDGKVVHTGKVHPSLDVVAESFARGAGDPHLTYRHGLTLTHPEANKPNTSAPKASAPRAKPAKPAKKPTKRTKQKRWF